MDENTSGFNKGKIEELGETMKASYNLLNNQIGEKIQAQLFVPMSTKWYAPEAQDYFNNKVAPKIIETGIKMGEAYNYFKDWIQQTGTDWAQNTGNSGNAPVLCEIPKTGIQNVDASIIVDQDGDGNIFLNETLAIAVAANLPSLHKEILNMVKAEHEKLDASMSFFGHGQAQAATRCFVRVADAIGELFQLLDDLSDVIKDAANNYKQFAQQLASRFDQSSVTVERDNLGE